MPTPEQIRRNLRELLALLADPEAQLAYERDVPIADVPAELLCMWFDDLYHPEVPNHQVAFSPEELRGIEAFHTQYDAARRELLPLPGAVAGLQAQPAWGRVVASAGALRRSLGVR